MLARDILRPNIHFVSKHDSLSAQTKNLEKWWNKYEIQVFEAIEYYVNCNWEIDSVTVYLERLSKKGSTATTYACEGEVLIKKPNEIHISIGNRVRWTNSNLRVFTHELVHCATHSRKDRRFGKPGLIEFWILDELATDLLAQFILKRETNFNQRILNSIEYALKEASDYIMKDKELRDELAKKAKRKIKNYLKTGKNFYSFRKDLMSL